MDKPETKTMEEIRNRMESIITESQKGVERLLDNYCMFEYRREFDNIFKNLKGKMDEALQLFNTTVTYNSKTCIMAAIEGIVVLNHINSLLEKNIAMLKERALN